MKGLQEIVKDNANAIRDARAARLRRSAADVVACWNEYGIGSEGLNVAIGNLERTLHETQ